MSQRELKIVCNDKSHATRTAVLDRLTFSDNRQSLNELHRELGFPTTDDGRGPWRLAAFGGTSESIHLETGDVVDPVKLYGKRGVAPTPGLTDVSRRRWNVTCPLCGLNVQAREDTLDRLLTPLVAHGVSEISLTALAARLS